MKLQYYIATWYILFFSHTQIYSQTACNSLPSCTSTINVPTTSIIINAGEVICLDIVSNTALDITFTGNGTLLIANGASVVVDEITSSSPSKIINLGNFETTAALDIPIELVFDNCGIVNAPFGLEIDAKFNNYPNAEIQVENQIIIGTNGILTSDMNMCITKLNGSLKTVNNETVFSFCYFKNVGNIEILDDLIVDGVFVSDGEVLVDTNSIVIKSSSNNSGTSEIVFRGIWRINGPVRLEGNLQIRTEEFIVESPGELLITDQTEVLVMLNIAEPLAPICSPILPVELVFFKVQKNKNSVQLQWQTLSELDNSHFEIERSKDAKNWEAIGEVKGAGISLEQLNYQFTDITPFIKNYYRLKQVDFDGQFTYSEVVYADFEKLTSKEVSLFPNPVSHILNVRFQDNKPRTIQIFNSSNQIVGVFNSTDPIDVEYLPEGIYTITGRYENTMWSERFLKK